MLSVDWKPLGLHGGREALRYANSFTRLPILLELWAGLAVNRIEWLNLLGEEWDCCDNIGLHTDDLLDDTPLAEMVGDEAIRISSREHLMSPDERAVFEALPDSFTVWRGCYANNKWGLSWSLERDVAARFPTLRRYQQEAQSLLVRARAQKSDVLALKAGRNEAEIIIHRPRHVSTSHLSVYPLHTR